MAHDDATALRDSIARWSAVYNQPAAGVDPAQARPSRLALDQAAPELADLFADNGTVYLNGAYRPGASADHPTWTAIFAENRSLAGGKAAELRAPLHHARFSGSLGSATEVRGDRLPMATRLLALARWLTEQRRRVCPDGLACTLWLLAVAAMLWLMLT